MKLYVRQVGPFDWRVMGHECYESEPRRTKGEAEILMHSLQLRNLMHS